MTPWETAVCQRAVEAYGKEHQLIICMEEMAELTKELSKKPPGPQQPPGDCRGGGRCGNHAGAGQAPV